MGHEKARAPCGVLHNYVKHGHIPHSAVNGLVDYLTTYVKHSLHSAKLISKTIHIMSQTEASPDGLPHILSRQDLTALCEVFDPETGANIRTTFTYVNSEHVAWFG